jgi:putative transposase
VRPLPQALQQAQLRRAALTWRADHDALAWTVDTGASLPASLAGGAVAGSALGEGHIAAVTTTRRPALIVSGRRRRACKPGRKRLHAILQEQRSQCQQGSRRARRLQRRKAQVSATRSRQQREILQQAAKTVGDFCQHEGVSRIAVGDVRDIQTGVSLGNTTNQTISQWPHGQFVRYRSEKAARRGLVVEWIDESDSTMTCRVSAHVQASSPRGRRLRCSGCGARLHRDVTGANTICSKAVSGVYGTIQADTVTYRRPIVVVPRHRPT